MNKTALVILNYNNAADTRNCLESILKFNTAPVKFIVVDNASTLHELEALKEVLSESFPGGYSVVKGEEPPTAEASLPLCTLVVNEKNLGYACGNNSGLEFARRDAEIDKIMILNNDILFVEDIIPGLCGLLLSLPNCGIVSPLLFKKGMKEYDMNCARLDTGMKGIISDNFLYYYYQWRKMSYLDIRPEMFLLLHDAPASGSIEVDLPSGSCMLIYKSVFEKIGFFDPNTFLYREENILFKKLQTRGYKNYLSLDYRCIHLGAASTKAVSRSAWLLRKAKESEEYYVKKYSGASLPTRLLYYASLKFFLVSLSLQKWLKKKL